MQIEEERQEAHKLQRKRGGRVNRVGRWEEKREGNTDRHGEGKQCVQSHHTRIFSLRGEREREKSTRGFSSNREEGSMGETSREELKDFLCVTGIVASLLP